MPNHRAEDTETHSPPTQTVVVGENGQAVFIDSDALEYYTDYFEATGELAPADYISPWFGGQPGNIETLSDYRTRLMVSIETAIAQAEETGQSIYDFLSEQAQREFERLGYGESAPGVIIREFFINGAGAINHHLNNIDLGDVLATVGAKSALFASTGAGIAGVGALVGGAIGFLSGLGDLLSRDNPTAKEVFIDTLTQTLGNIGQVDTLIFGGVNYSGFRYEPVVTPAQAESLLAEFKSMFSGTPLAGKANSLTISHNGGSNTVLAGTIYISPQPQPTTVSSLVMPGVLGVIAYLLSKG